MAKKLKRHYFKVIFLLFSCVFLMPLVSRATNRINAVPIFMRDTNFNKTNEYLTLRQCIDYALLHQPALNRSLINIDIARATNAVNLAGWLPQVTGTANFTHYIQFGYGGSGVTNTSGGTTTTGGTTTGTTTGGTTTGTTTGGTTTGTTTGGTTTTGTAATGTTSFSRLPNAFLPQVGVSQAIFSPTLLYAARSANLYIDQAKEVTDSTKIYLVTAVSKTFYNLLLTLQQINVFKEDTARLGKSLRDAYTQYKGGIVDETGYEQASITLNNSIAQLRQANENVTPQYATLKQLMGYPPEKQFNVSFDTLQMKQELTVDTLQQLQYERRIEYKALTTQKALQTETINYYRLAFLPTVSAFYNYSPQFESSQLSNLFTASYPSSSVGLSLSIPIFTGFARLHNLRKARLQQELNNWNETELKSQFYTEYTTALANYKYNYFNLQLLKKNVALAKRVYFVVDLQYKQGIVPYLNVITAESNLITAEISYTNALFTVLSNKIDLQRSLGNITY
jgi:outer membrane protein TolC